MKERPVFTLVLPLPSMLTCTVTAVSFVILSILAFLAAANVIIYRAARTLFKLTGWLVQYFIYTSLEYPAGLPGTNFSQNQYKLSRASGQPVLYPRQHRTIYFLCEQALVF